LELVTALCIEQMKKPTSIIVKRRLNGDMPQETMFNNSVLMIEREHDMSIWFRFLMLISPSIDMARDHFLSRLCALVLKACTVVVGHLPKNEIKKHNYADFLLR